MIKNKKNKMRKTMQHSILYTFFIIGLTCFIALWSNQANAACCSCPDSVQKVEVVEWDLSETGKTGTVPMINNHVTKEFEGHRKWFIDDFFNDYLLPAMQMMTNQLTGVAMQQVTIFGAFLDAKHQLETQRLFQKIQARAHKDYHPSVGMCEFGSSIKSLASSERRAELNALAMSSNLLDRHLGKAGNAAAEGTGKDLDARIAQYDTTFCDKADNLGNLDGICETGASDHTRKNNDINYAKIIDSKTQSKINFTDGTTEPDEEDVMALAKNLYGHRVLPRPQPLSLEDDALKPNNATSMQQAYLDARALIAKRSVAENSFNAIVGMKSAGTSGSKQFLKALLEDLDIPDTDAEKILGDNPSYDTQMDILTKKIYQNPNFYTNLYDKPANVARKQVAMQAIGLMQKFDTFKSHLRSEANLSILLELAVSDLQNRTENPLPASGGGR